MEPLGGVEYPGGLRLSDTVQALSAALRPGEPVLPGLWFKESSSRNLRHRDFLAPKAALSALYRRGQIPEDLIQRISSIHAAGVPPIQSCELTDFGLAVRLERSLVFQQVLAHSPCYLKPSTSNSAIVKNVILNCVALHGCKSPDALKLSHLRAILVADHLAEILRAEGTSVHLVPGLREESFKHFLQELKVPWPSVVEDSSICSATLALKDTLQNSTCAEAFRAEISHLQEQDVQAKDVVCRVRLKGFLEQRCLEGYDPNLDLFTVLEENLQHLAEIQQAVRQCQVEDASSGCMVIHVVNCEEEFQQQKMDLLWQLLEPGEHSASQKHLVCGPVKVSSSPSSTTSAAHYFQLRRAQMRGASVMKYGDLVQGDSWDEIVDALTSAAIRFEMLATSHRSQVTLVLEDTSISTKGTKSGTFVMYNCARLATLFQSYHSGVHQGLYPKLPAPSELNCKTLREEGEWILLFNYILPFPDVLSEAAHLPVSAKGIRITANTEAVCKFLVNLSMDFSSYYNRVHILGEPLPHLYSQMFARLQLMKALQSVLHSALATLHIPPLSQL
ncbi:DALR anticodon-binding domain-containing protein 3 isoform X1 [Ambystoma mexicanum]|uniref:DALR anticodon-binding domain-containing protein 3 isoform X1 n=1 Tax=Ambystoma mexicanum TaxID=8296 RepID=UPI0037E8C328